MSTSRLAQIRERQNKSRYQVSKDTGINYDTLSKLENLRGPLIRREHMRKLQEYYDVELTVEDFLS